MKFDYSYRAFLISCLLVGGLVLLMLSVKLGGLAAPVEEPEAVEYIALPEITEPEENSQSDNERVRTNRAYNEAARFIAEAERENGKVSEATAEKLQQIDQVLENAQQEFDLPDEALEEVLERTGERTEEKPIDTKERNSTASFNLKDRSVLYFPNPVYTCDRGGKIVISITVNGAGKVTKAEYNPVLSASTNQCLIDQAIEYARESRFNPSAERSSQLGTITYRFPGQD